MAKRKQGTGTIRQRADGRWEGRPPAPYNKKSFYGKNKTEVSRKIKEFMESQNKEHYIDGRRTTVDEFLETFIRDIKINELKPRSLDLLMYAARLIHPHIGSVRVTELTTFDIQRMLNNLKKDGYAISSIGKTYKLLKQAYKYGMAVTPPIVTKNPCEGVKMPKNVDSSSTDIQIFTDDEVTRICEAALAKKDNSCAPQER